MKKPTKKHILFKTIIALSILSVAFSSTIILESKLLALLSVFMTAFLISRIAYEINHHTSLRYHCEIHNLYWESWDHILEKENYGCPKCLLAQKVE